MGTEVEPVIGNWYVNRDNDDHFKVLGIDEIEQTIQIQHADANLDELQLSNWYQLNVDYSEPELDLAAPTSDTDEGLHDLTAEDPHAARLPADRERYRKEYVDYAGKAGEGFPEPRPGHDENDRFERGSEIGLEQWPETRERPRGS